MTRRQPRHGTRLTRPTMLTSTAAARGGAVAAGRQAAACYQSITTGVIELI